MRINVHCYRCEKISEVEFSSSAPHEEIAFKCPRCGAITTVHPTWRLDTGKKEEERDEFVRKSV